MRIEVDRTRCEGHGLCVYEAQEVFDLDDEGVLVLLDPTPPDTLRAAVEGARGTCPTAAISIVD